MASFVGEAIDSKYSTNEKDKQSNQILTWYPNRESIIYYWAEIKTPAPKAVSECPNHLATPPPFYELSVSVWIVFVCIKERQCVYV